MTKKELIAKIQAKAPVSKADTAAVLEALVEVVTEELENGGQVNLAKFGTFVAAKRGVRLGRNPRTGETVEIPASVVPKFKASSVLKARVSQQAA